MHFNLFYLADPSFGGWVTYTVHLAQSLEACGHTWALFKVRERTDPPHRVRDFGSGLTYRNLAQLDAELLVATGPALVVAMGPKHLDVAAALVTAGARIVIHDPTELNAQVCAALHAARARVVVIRESNVPHLQRAQLEPVFVPHPYIAHAHPVPNRRVHAVAISRLDWDKHTLDIAAANARLPLERRVVIYGAENRMYTHLKIDKALGTDWRVQYRGRYPATFDAAVELAADARFMVDLSAIAGDGDGTQYTFLEAWDAGAALVVSRKWCTTGKGAVNETTAEVVDDVAALVHVLEGAPNARKVAAGRRQLAQHAPAAVVPRYVELFA